MRLFFTLLFCSSVNFAVFGLAESGRKAWLCLLGALITTPLAIYALLGVMAESYEPSPLDLPFYMKLSVCAVVAIDGLTAVVAAVCMIRDMTLREVRRPYMYAPFIGGVMALAGSMLYAGVSSFLS